MHVYRSIVPIVIPSKGTATTQQDTTKKLEDNDSETDSNQTSRWSTTVPNVFKRIEDNSMLSLSGDGIVLYPGKDPNGVLSISFR